MHRAALVVLALALAIAAPAEAQSPAPYLTAEDVALARLLPPPPVAGGSFEREELEEIADVQRSTSQDRIKRAIADADNAIFAMFSGILGPNFTAARLPKAAAFFGRIQVTESRLVEPAKAYFHRARPYAVSKEIRNLIPPEASAAYPSGHATRVTLAASILGFMMPELSRPIWARAEQYAESRVIVGVHYPSDLESGRRAGTAIAAVLFSRPDFRADLESAKAEVRSALGVASN